MRRGGQGLRVRVDDMDGHVRLRLLPGVGEGIDGLGCEGGDREQGPSVGTSPLLPKLGPRTHGSGGCPLRYGRQDLLLLLPLAALGVREGELARGVPEGVPLGHRAHDVVLEVRPLDT